MKRNLLFYMETGGIGGAEKYINLLYSQEFNDLYNIKLIIVTDNESADFRRYYNRYDVIIIRYKTRRYYLNITRLLFKIFKMFQWADIVHFNKTAPAQCLIPIFFISLLRNKLKVATEHLAIPISSKYFFKPLVTGFFVHLASRLLNKTIVVCKTSKEFFIKHYKYHSGKTFVIYIGFRLESGSHDSYLDTDISNRIGLDRNKIISIIGRVVPQKNHLDAIRILKILIDRKYKIKLLIVGETLDPVYKNKINDLIKYNNIEEYVIFLGYLDDIAPIIVATDIVLMPSLWEDFPNVVKEAGILSRVTAAYDVGGIKECIVDGQTGLLTDIGNYCALADKIEFFLKNNDFRNKMEFNIHRQVIEMFNDKEMINKTLSLYESK